MSKKIEILFIILCILILTGCGNSNVTKNNDNIAKCSINNDTGDYFINETMKCPQFKDIAYASSGFFITKSGELYEYSNKKYSTTNNNCKMVETDILFDKIIMNTLVSRNGDFYSFYDGKLKKITNNEIKEGRTAYGLNQMEIRLYKLNNEIFYLYQSDMNELYGYVDGNNIYEIIYNYKTNKPNEKLLLTLEDGENFEKATNGYVITNKGYYKYGITNQKECYEYEDIKCEYGLVLVDTIKNCSNEILYISDNLIITQNMVR